MTIRPHGGAFTSTRSLPRKSKTKMASTDLGKDLLLIHARIFKHQAVLDGEVKYFIKEFESRRNNRELARLEEIESNASRIDRNLSECVELPARLKSLQEKIEGASKTANTILSRDNNDEAVRNERKMKRDAEWEVFLKEIEAAKQDVELRHRDRIDKLKSEKQQQDTP